ncbi:MFS general substrate transporter [Phellopilus nigrolimitatus]|nr:MFS general substrate transporter [Phellopilus nigrolimitatus]
MTTGDSFDNFNHHDEARPLLHGPERQKLYGRQEAPTPLPKLQLATLCTIRLADPIAFTMIFPFVNEMMERFGIAEPSKTGFYSGLVESVFALSQLVSIYQWASLSDRIGRRPVVFLGTIGIALSTILLGFSTTLATILISRSLAGLFSGNVAVMHSVLAELTNATNQALAYPIYGLCWPLGVIIGPLIGGTFSNAAQKYPKWFGTAIFEVFPYLLPCLVVAATTMISVCLGYFLLKETLPSKTRTKKEYSISYGVSEHRDHLLSEETSHCARTLLHLPVMRALCVSGCALSFVGSAFDVVFVLFCYSPVQNGGLSFSVSQIGYALAIAGISSAVIQIVFMPLMLHIISCARLYKVCMSLWPFTFFFLPLLNWLARMGYDETSDVISSYDVRQMLWFGIGITLALSRVACLAFSLNMILVKEHAPGPSSLGSVNGLAQFSQCLARAVAPAFVSSLFAFSVDHSVMGGHFWMAVMVVISALSCLHSVSALPEDSASANGGANVSNACSGI